MRLDFESIIKNYGHNVYLQRHDLGSKGEINYRENLELHTVRYSVGRFDGLAARRQEALEGVLNTSDRVYYFLSSVNPYENDRIYENVPRNDQNTEVWILDAVVPMRGINGEIIYWAAGSTRIEDN